VGILNLEDTKIKASSSDAMLVSPISILSVADKTRVVIGQFSIGATASGICEACCDWLIRGNKFGSG